MTGWETLVQRTVPLMVTGGTARRDSSSLPSLTSSPSPGSGAASGDAYWVAARATSTFPVLFAIRFLGTPGKLPSNPLTLVLAQIRSVLVPVPASQILY
jgi:hypothetical protein